MGLWDSLLGRSQPKAPDLDALFSVPQAALTLEAGAGFQPTGVGSVCYRENEGAAFANVQADVQQLLDADGGKPVERTSDGFGFTWLTCRQDPGSVTDLVTELHAVNRSLEEQGFGPSLLCSVVGFTDASGRPLGLVYLYKRGSFYPFAPLSGERRDNSLELQVRGLVAADVPLEPELGRWMALWGAPGLT